MLGSLISVLQPQRTHFIMCWFIWWVGKSKIPKDGISGPLSSPLNCFLSLPSVRPFDFYLFFYTRGFNSPTSSHTHVPATLYRSNEWAQLNSLVNVVSDQTGICSKSIVMWFEILAFEWFYVPEEGKSTGKVCFGKISLQSNMSSPWWHVKPYYWTFYFWFVNTCFHRCGPNSYYS